MNALEDRVTGALRELGQQSSRLTAAVPAAHGRSPFLVPLAAAAAAATVLGVAALSGLAQFGHQGNPTDSSGTGSTPVQSSPTPSRAQVNEVAERASAFWQQPGFGNVTVDYLAGTVTVRWKGAPPEEVTAMVGPQDTGAVVTLLPAAWSQAEAEAAGDRLFSATLAQLDGATVFATHPTGDMSGLMVEVVRPWSGSEAALEDIAGMPIEVELVEDVREPLGR